MDVDPEFGTGIMMVCTFGDMEDIKKWRIDSLETKLIFDENGKVVKKATFTVLHNGVLIQDHVKLTGGTGWRGPHSVSEYKAHPDAMPIQLQDHGNPVRFRNVWVRPPDDHAFLYE